MIDMSSPPIPVQTNVRVVLLWSACIVNVVFMRLGFYVNLLVVVKIGETETVRKMRKRSQ